MGVRVHVCLAVLPSGWLQLRLWPVTSAVQFLGRVSSDYGEMQRRHATHSPASRDVCRPVTRAHLLFGCQTAAPSLQLAAFKALHKDLVKSSDRPNSPTHNSHDMRCRGV